MPNLTDRASTVVAVAATSALARVESAGVYFPSAETDGDGWRRSDSPPPRIVVDAVRPDDRHVHLRRRIIQHFSAGAQLVWMLDAATRTVRIYRAIETARVLSAGDVLDGEEVLPGFAVAVAELFEERNEGGREEGSL
jgi:Uma2 family endonuclease